jgi:hypothetical protein
MPVPGVSATVGHLSVTDKTPITYLGPDVQRPGYVIHDETGTDQTLELGIAMLFISTLDGEVVSGPQGVEAIGVTIALPADGEAIAPFVWNPIDCRTQRAIAPGSYRAVLDFLGPDFIAVDELIITP